MKTTAQQRISAGQQGAPSSRDGDARKKSFGQLARTLQLGLVASRSGRIVLHLLVALQTGHFLWHWRGIVRELTRV